MTKVQKTFEIHLLEASHLSYKTLSKARMLSVRIDRKIKEELLSHNFKKSSHNRYQCICGICALFYEFKDKIHIWNGSVNNIRSEITKNTLKCTLTKDDHLCYDIIT